MSHSVHAFEDREVYGATLVLNLALFGVTVAFVSKPFGRLLVGLVSVAASFMIFVQLKDQLTLFDAHLCVVNGVLVLTLYWGTDHLRRISWKGLTPELWYALAVTALALVIMALPNAFRKSDEATALEVGRRFVDMLREDNAVAFYNALHPKVKEDLSLEEVRRVLRDRASVLRHLSIVGVVTQREYDEVECRSESGKRIVVRQRFYSGRGRVTDGTIVALRDYENDPVILDVYIDGTPIFGADLR